MWPEVHWGGFQISSSIVLLIVSIVGSALLNQIYLRRDFGFLQRTSLITCSAAAGILGGRLFHVLVERWSYFRDHPQEIFSRFDGMTLYGAVGGAALSYYFGLRFMGANPYARARAWDAAAITASFVTAVLRLGCFFEGCCWGKVTHVPWAVQFFDSHSHMPLLGVPVHPVQLYESFLAAALMVYLIGVDSKRPEQRGTLIWQYFLLYGCIRLFTEMFRADGIRGFVLGGLLSTSQAISIVMVVLSGVQLLRGALCKRKFSAA